MKNEVFELKEEHIKLLSQSYIEWNGSEFGTPSIDPKMPYGNSNVLEDIAAILEIKPDFEKDGEIYFSSEKDEQMLNLHSDLAKALQIVLCTMSFKPGVYETEPYEALSWKLVE